MADSNSPNILLLIADPNDVYNYTAHFGNNFTTIDGLMGAVDCLSTARPSNTYKGQIVYERDSGRYAQNTGTKSSAAWTYMSHSAMTATSSARPSSGLSTSLLAWETDSTGLVVWNGASWTHLSYKAFTCTSSTRPSGTQVFTGLIIWESDTSRFLVYNGAAWEQLSFTNFVATSSAHPASPFTGLEIFETDTGMSAIYNGSNYLYNVQQVAPSQLLASPVASVTFTGLPAVNHLSLYWHARSTSGNTSDNLTLQFNNDAANNYDWQILAGLNTTVSTTPGLGDTKILVGTVVGGAGSAGFFSNGEIDVMGVIKAASGHVATVRGSWYSCWSGSAATSQVGLAGGLYTPGAAITSLKLTPAAGSFATNSVFTLLAAM